MCVNLQVVFCIPYSIFYYEADDGMGNKKEKQWLSAAKYEFVVLLVAVLTLVLMYNFLGFTEIPVEHYTVDMLTLDPLIDDPTGSDVSGFDVEAAPIPGDGAGHCGPCVAGGSASRGTLF